MNIKKSLSLLKTKIDEYEYGKNATGEPITGLKALRDYLKDNCTTNSVITEAYIRKELTKLYKKLEQNEAGKVLDSDHFSFMKDTDVFYHILKALRLSFEDLMEGGNNNYRPKTEIDSLHDEHAEILCKLQTLTDIAELEYAKTGRTDIQKKTIEYNNFFGNCLTFSNINYQLKTTTGLKFELLSQSIRFNLMMAINNISGLVFDFNSMSKLATQKIPVEYLQLEYYRAVQYSKLSGIARAILILEDEDKNNYYDELADKLRNEIITNLEESPDSLSGENYLRYSCIICQFDFINRTTIAFLNSIFKNFKYRYGENLVKNFSSTPFNFATPQKWNDYFLAIFNYNNTLFPYNFSKFHAENFRKFLKKIGSMLRQLSNYLATINLRNYTVAVVDEITCLFNDYLLIIQNVIYLSNWIIMPKAEEMMEKLIEQLDNHTKIISHDMAGAIDEVD